MVATNKNKVQPLQWNVPIVTQDGTPTAEFVRAWAQQQVTNGTIPNFTTGYPLHYVFAASPLGPSQPPAFRLLVVADIPNLSSLYDIAGAAAAAQTAAEAFAADASNISSGTVGPSFLPSATTAAFGVVKPDGTTITISGGVISAVGGGSGGGPASIVDTGSAIELAMSDSSGQLVLDSHGNPIFMTEVFPVASIPMLPYILTARTIGF